MKLPSTLRGVVVWCLAVLSLGFASAETVLLRETFAGNVNWPDQKYPDTSEWFCSWANGASKANGKLTIDPGGHVLTYFTKYQVHLNEDHDTLTARFKFSVDSPLQATGALRVGFFNSFGRRVLADGEGISLEKFSHYRGYAAFLNFRSSTGMRVLQRLTGTNFLGLIHTGSAYAGTAHSGPAFGIESGQVYTGILSLERTGTSTAVTMKVLSGETEVTQATLVSGTTPTAFDTFAIYGAPNTMNSVTLEEVEISSSNSLLLMEQFALNERLTKNLPWTTAWFTPYSGTAVAQVAQSDPNHNELTSLGNRFVSASFTKDGNRIPLAVGDSLRAEFEVKFGFTPPLSLNSAFRVGLFNSGETPLDRDGTTLSHDLFKDDTGYAAVYHFNQPNALTLRKRNTGNPALIHSGSVFSDLAGGTVSGTFGVNPDTYYRGWLNLTRTGTGALSVSAGIGDSPAFQGTATDASAPAKGFDALVVFTSTTPGANTFTIRNATVTRSWKPSSVWLDYAQNPDTHPNIPNCSYAGYHYGEQPIPTFSGSTYPEIVPNVATGTSSQIALANAQALRTAVESVGPSGAVVRIPEGEYHIDGLIFVHKDGTVLRGAGVGKTKLVFKRPLNEVHGVSIYNTSSRWSYSGGLIWFTGTAVVSGTRYPGNTYRNPATPIGESEYLEWWNTNGIIGTVSGTALRGDRSITLSSVDKPVAAGDFVLLQQTDPGDYTLIKHLAGGGRWANNSPTHPLEPGYDWTQNTSAGWPDPQDTKLKWVAEVLSVNGTTITFRQPLRFKVDPAVWTPKLYALKPMIKECGIEEMTIRFDRTSEWDPDLDHHKEKGWNGPFFNNAVNCWVKNVTLVDMETGATMSNSKLITFTGLRLEATDGDRMRHHHGTQIRGASHDNLIEDLTIASYPLHGAETSSFSTGNVYSRARLEHGTFDMHRGMAFEGMRTESVLVANDGFHGGNGGPTMGARYVNWNVEVQTPGRNYMVGWANAMPNGAIVGLRGVNYTWEGKDQDYPTWINCSDCLIHLATLSPASPNTVEPNPPNLYEEQLRLRLSGTGQ